MSDETKPESAEAPPAGKPSAPGEHNLRRRTNARREHSHGHSTPRIRGGKAGRSSGTRRGSRGAAAPAPKKDDASPTAPRPSVVYAGVAALSVENIVVPHHHTVRPGETLERIAQDYYGDRKKASVIALANKDLVAGSPLVPGTKVKVPKG